MGFVQDQQGLVALAQGLGLLPKTRVGQDQAAIGQGGLGQHSRHLIVGQGRRQGR
jgi:hypothetical protein